MSAVVQDEIIAEGDYGPAMSLLDARRQRFVEAVLSQRGRPNYAQAARAAGYSDHLEAAKVAGFQLIRQPKVIAALHEESRRRFTVQGYYAVVGLADIADNKDHPDHYKALVQLADRFGYAAVTEHKVKVEHTDLTGDAIMQRIKALAAKHGLDQAKLLGSNVADQPQVVSRETQVIEATATEVKE